MGTFYLKYRDTRPVFETVLHDPAPAGSPPGTLGPVHDLTGATSATLHVRLKDGTDVLSRGLVIDSDPKTGIVRYIWLMSDWNAGALVSGEFEMECEVLGPSNARLTFPNTRHDRLLIWSDIGQAQP